MLPKGHAVPDPALHAMLARSGRWLLGPACQETAVPESHLDPVPGRAPQHVVCPDGPTHNRRDRISQRNRGGGTNTNGDEWFSEASAAFLPADPLLDPPSEDPSAPCLSQRSCPPKKNCIGPLAWLRAPVWDSLALEFSLCFYEVLRCCCFYLRVFDGCGLKWEKVVFITHPHNSSLS